MFQYIPFTRVFKIAYNSYGSYGSESCSFGTFDLNCSIDLNSWTIWFRWNLLSPSWIEFGIHPWCTPLISAHCITIPPKTSSSSSSSSPSSSSPSSGKNRILRMIIMQMPRGRVGSHAIRKIFLTKVFHLRLDHRWKDFRGRRDFPLAQHSFAFSFLKVEIPAKEFALPLWGWPGFWNLFKNCCALSPMLFDNRKFSTFRLIHLIGHKRISGICRILQILDFICAQIGIKSISYTFGLIKLIGSV